MICRQSSPFQPDPMRRPVVMDQVVAPVIAPSSRRWHLCLAILFLLAISGCREWHADETPASLLIPPQRLRADAVELEIGVAQLDESQAADLQQLWRVLDQQELPFTLRKQLDQHGLRVAVMSSRPPSVLADLIYPKELIHEELTGLEQQLYLKGHLSAKSRMIGHTRVRNRNGQSYPIPTSDTHDFFSWAVKSQGKHLVGSGNHVRGIFSISTQPLGDGSVRVFVEPQIHHGEARQRIGSSEHGFKLERTQSVEDLDPLRFEVTLRAGESLVIGPTEDIDHLGRLFFGPTKQKSKSPGSDDVDSAPLAQLDTTLDALAAMVDEMPSRDPLNEDQSPAAQPEEQPVTEELVAEPFDKQPLPGDTPAQDDLSPQDRAQLEAEVREMLTAKEGEEAVLPKFTFAAESKGPQPLHRILLIRVLQTQLDELFTEIEETTPLTNVDRY